MSASAGQAPKGGGGRAGNEPAGAGEGRKVIASNRRAHYEYEVLERYEAGLILQGTEVKALRDGQCSIQEAYARPSGDGGGVVLIGAHIPEYRNGTYANHVPDRPRKLLLHRREARKLALTVEQRGLTLIPLLIYFRRGYAKVELGVCRGKKLHDKRQDLKAKDHKKEIDRAMSRDRG